MRLLFIIFSLGTLFANVGCKTLKPQHFESSRPLLRPENFFVGHTKSSGVVETHGGKPSAQITTETQGTLKDGIIYIEQDLMTEGKKKKHRSWKMRQVDAHHVEATANDIAGTAYGHLYGNYFTWKFTLKLAPHNPIKRVRMTQTMYLQPDGQTLIIRSVLRKFGIIVAQLTEEFKKE